eukprot:TRINITY_DN720_c0_g1_i1.p1 TRINITY_DN720_c0_g1~~TRINITY_DN720_c0_g1_i1.p1  ORF type:complete len:320 (+),score=123.87 TRINITY_DN720_c0_g1_i1:961-1920(+)
MKIAAVGTVTHAESDGMKFKPNPNLMAEDAGDDETETASSTGVYKAPRISAVYYQEEENAKKQHKEDLKTKEKAKRSTMINFLKEQYGDAPEELSNDVSGITDYRSQAAQHEKERDEFEEEHFIRMQISKKDKNKKKRQMIKNDLEDFEDFADLRVLDKRAPTSSDLAAVEPLPKKAKADSGGLITDYINMDGLDDMEDLDDDDFYKQMTNSTTAKKQTKKSKAEAVKKEKEREFVPKWTDEIEEGDRRNVGNDIEKNRGLKPYRSKLNRNPRVKHRVKFETALKRRKGQTKEYSAPAGPYGGEKTGIKKNVVKSVKLK